jgi:hypothetical protein
VFHGIHSYQNGELGRLRGVLWAAGHDSNGIQHTMYISIEYLSSRHLRLTPRVLIAKVLGWFSLKRVRAPLVSLGLLAGRTLRLTSPFRSPILEEPLALGSGRYGSDP